MKILVLNSGSSSLKYQLIDMKNDKLLAKGICEEIGSEKSSVEQTTWDNKQINKTIKNLSDHKKAFTCIQNMLLDENFGVIKNISEIEAVGHRVVHGGEHFKGPALVNDEVLEKIKSLITLAPLHNPANLSGILACREILGENVPQVAVFDTSFYSEIPEKAYMFAVPYEYYENYRIRKYGFHGTSHKYVSRRCCKVVNKDFSKTKIISCHLGNGSSITAIENGKAVETSMGLTPLGGIMMGTRSGSLDPSVILYIGEKESLSVKEMNEILNKKSGLLGVSGISNDDRSVLKAKNDGNKRAALAHEMLVYQITQFIGAYTAVMQGCDVLIFTGGIGENQWMHRERICSNLAFMGVKIDKDINKNTILRKEAKISTSDSKIDVFVIPTNEELAIAYDTLNVIKH